MPASRPLWMSDRDAASRDTVKVKKAAPKAASKTPSTPKKVPTPTKKPSKKKVHGPTGAQRSGSTSKDPRTAKATPAPAKKAKKAKPQTAPRKKAIKTRMKTAVKAEVAAPKKSGGLISRMQLDTGKYVRASARKAKRAN